MSDPLLLRKRRRQVTSAVPFRHHGTQMRPDGESRATCVLQEVLEGGPTLSSALGARVLPSLLLYLHKTRASSGTKRLV